ncbi:MAG: Aldose 1-epimerase, partial [Myxococcaceae bacterium]|nr:Aldose 1-epimerase [Myxococcaceae bacterium]
GGRVTVRAEAFGVAADGAAVRRFTLTNARGSAAQVTDYGATLLGLWVPDRDGRLDDVVLGFDALDPYTREHPYFGSTVGRYANRIAGGRFSLDGREYALARNDPPNHLHGGPRGFHRRVWGAGAADPDGGSLRLTLESPDGEEGYPGALSVALTYTLTDDDALRLDYEATTDAATIVNLTHHSYFNLAGAGDVLAHELALAAPRFVPIDPTGIPLGGTLPVEGTPMDFLAPTAVGARLGADDAQLRAGRGYDHCWALDGPSGELRRVATLTDPASGRAMVVHTTEPGLQVYAGNRLDGSLAGKGGRRYPRYAGICLEAQRFPDSPNRPEFPSATLRPGEPYRQTTEYRFLHRRNTP